MLYSKLTEEQATKKLAEIMTKTNDAGHGIWEAIKRACDERKWQEAVDLAYILTLNGYDEIQFPQSGKLIIAREELGLKCGDYPYAAENRYNGLMPEEEISRFNKHTEECEVCWHRAMVFDVIRLYEKSCKAYKEGDIKGFHKLHDNRQLPEFFVDRYLYLAYRQLCKALESEEWDEVLRLADNMSLLKSNHTFDVSAKVKTAQAEKE